jgi:diguanylate cyclase (GGDEF)-like protein
MNVMNDLFRNGVRLPSPPNVAIKLLQIIKKDHLSLQELSDVISYDSAMAAKILKISNSAFYALPCSIDSIDKAISVLGMDVLKNMTLSFALIKDMRKDKTDGFDHEFFWRRSLTAAVSAEMISSKLGGIYKESFVTALLMDIGILAMFLSRPEDYLRVFYEKRVSGLSIIDAERSLFNYDHQQAGSMLLEKWRIPENICSLIAGHHSQNGIQPHLLPVQKILQIADLTSSVYHGNRNIEKFNRLKGMFEKEINANKGDFDIYLDDVACKTIELLSFFDIGKADMKPFSEVLQEANEELQKLNLSYEHVIIELHEAKKKSDSFAMELKKMNTQLRELSYKDGLTGLYNHRYFHEMMDKEMNRAKKSRNTLSLIIIDIDNFKHINDAYGHPQGDEVLRYVGSILKQSIRACDILSRYGGEEFTIMLPETDIRGAAVIGERVRRSVEGRLVNCNGNSIKVTVSLGATAFDPVQTPDNKSMILNAADKALYDAKMNGKNRISIASI